MKKSRYFDVALGATEPCAFWSGGDVTCEKDGSIFFSQLLPWLHNKTASSSPPYSGLPIYQGFEEIESTEFKKPLWNDCMHYRRVHNGQVHSAAYYLGYPPISNWACPGTTTKSPASQRIGYQWRGYGKRIATVNNTKPGFTFVQPLDPGYGNTPDLNFRAEAWANFQPRFKGEVSTLNFLFELKDFRDIAGPLVRSVRKFLDWCMYSNLNPVRVLAELTDQSERIRKTLPSPERGSLPADYWNFTRPIAGSWLTYSFAVAPLLRDIADLLAMFAQMAHNAWSKFQDKGLTAHTVHFSKVFVRKNTLAPVWSDYAAEPCIYHTGGYSFEKWTANMMRTYTMAPKSDWDITKLFWGLELTAEAVWNALPFSFLADYIISIGKSLKLAYREPGVNLRTIQYCESILRSDSHGIFINPNHLPIWYYTTKGGLEKLNLNGVPKLVTGIQQSRYNRWLAVPYFGPFLPEFKAISTTQMVNVAALLRCVF